MSDRGTASVGVWTEFLAAVVRQVPRPEDAESSVFDGWVKNQADLKKVLASVLLPPVNASVTEFTVFKTIKLGTGIKDADGFRQAIKDNKMRFNDYANDILGKPAFSMATEETEVDLVVVSVADLGFPKVTTLKNIYIRAKEKGLQLCPNEVGPKLRLQYKDQPKGEWLTIGMEPITGSGGLLCLFNVEHNDNDLWLNASFGRPDGVWPERYRFVFVLPRK